MSYSISKVMYPEMSTAKLTKKSDNNKTFLNKIMYFNREMPII